MKILKQVEDSIIEKHKQFHEEIYKWPTVDEDLQAAAGFIEFDGEYDYVPWNFSTYILWVKYCYFLAVEQKYVICKLNNCFFKCFV